MLKDTITEKLHLGIIYHKSSEWWNVPYLTNKLSKFNNNLQITSFEASEINNKTNLPSNIQALTLLPSEVHLIPLFLNTNNELKWIHSMFGGVEKFLNLSEIKNNEKIILTNSKGAFVDSLTEFSVFSMLYFSYNAPAYISSFSQRKWIRPVNKMLKNKTLLIVGYGLCGADLAQKAKNSYGLKVFGVRTNMKNRTGSEHLEALISFSEFESFIPEADFVVSFLPHTAETINLFNFEIFSKMKNTSVFINLGRGSSVVEADLVKALKDKRIKGAALDVTQMEPLSVDSDLYTLENVFLSCHSANNTDEYFYQAVELFEKNIELYFGEGQFYTQVDKVKGY